MLFKEHFFSKIYQVLFWDHHQLPHHALLNGVQSVIPFNSKNEEVVVFLLFFFPKPAQDVKNGQAR